MDPIATLDGLPRLRLCQLPTPLQRLERLERALGLVNGPRLFMKRDDLTGLALGGNKGRKLEFSLADARRQGADLVLTYGGVQSNHCRQTALAGAALGFEVHLFLAGDRPERMTGNLLPSSLAGAHIHFNADAAAMEAFAERARGDGRRPYLIPAGASNAVGICGYVNAAREIAAHQRRLGVEFDRIVIAGGTTGTQAGLLVGAKLFGLSARVVGVAVGVIDLPACQDAVASNARRTAELLGMPAPVRRDEVEVLCDYVGPGYAKPTPAGREAIELLASNEGILLDPAYTGKAMAGLIDQLRQGAIGADETILFIHTGGWLALLA